MTTTTMHIPENALHVLDSFLLDISPRVAAIMRIVFEEHKTIDAIRTGHVAFHFTEGSEVKTKYKNEMHVSFEGALAVRST